MGGNEAEVAGLRIILSNVVARLAVDGNGRELIGEMAHQCKLAAEHMASAGPDRARLVQETQTFVDEFFKGITIS